MFKQINFLLSLMLVMLLAGCQDAVTDSNNNQTVSESDTKRHPAAIANKPNKVHTNVDGRKTKIVTKYLDTGGMKWITMEQASELKNNEGKKFLVDVYTDWCGWCKVMDKKTFSDKNVKKYLEDNYHLVKFNAEQTDPIKFKNKTYSWAELGRNGINTLAMDILGNQMSYPTLVYFDENLDKINVSPGYKGPEQLLAELKGMDN